MVKNEARFVWYSVMSVAAFVDKVWILDTGSTDSTWKILQELATDKSLKNKVFLKRMDGDFDEEKIRQQMLDETDTDWFIVVDGDEVWWNDSIKKVCQSIQKFGDRYESVVVPYINLVGDIFHFQEETAGNYHLAGRVGHLALRGINTKIPGLHSLGAHGVWGWVDENDKMVQNRGHGKILFVDVPYLHASFLQRSDFALNDKQVLKRSFKRKHEIGISFPKDYYYPESFFYERPAVVPDIWEKMDTSFFIKSLFLSPLRKIKRRILPKKVGY